MMHVAFNPSSGDDVRVYSGGSDDAPDVRLWTDSHHIDFRVPGMTRADADMIAEILCIALTRARAEAAGYKIAAE